MRIFYRLLLSAYYLRFFLSRIRFDDATNNQIKQVAKLLNVVLSHQYYKHMSEADKLTIRKIMRVKTDFESKPTIYGVKDSESTIPNLFEIFNRLQVAKKIIFSQNRLDKDNQDYSRIFAILNYSDCEMRQLIKVLQEIIKNCETSFAKKG